MGSMSGTAMRLDALSPSFSSLYREYFGFAWSSLRRLGVSSATIDDATQDLWVTVHRRLESLDAAASVKAWLFGIARRVASHYRRTERRHRRKLAALAEAPVQRSSEPMKRREAAMTMEVFLARLDETKRVAFVLSELEGWSAPEIARVVGTSPNTVYSRIRLARKQLREHLQASEANLTPAACVAAARTSTEPPPDAARRCWVALAPKLAGSTAVATAATTGALSKLGLVALGSLIGGLGIVGLDAAWPEAAPPEPGPAMVHAPQSDPSIPPAPATVRVQAPAPAPPPPTNDEVATNLSPEPTRRLPAEPVAPEPKPELEPDPLVEETKLLMEAKRQLTAGDPRAALSTIAAHAKAHPESKLADVRNVLEVEATCARGQREQAEALAKHYAARASPAAAQKLRAACSDPTSLKPRNR